MYHYCWIETSLREQVIKNIMDVSLLLDRNITQRVGNTNPTKYHNVHFLNSFGLIFDAQWYIYSCLNKKKYFRFLTKEITFIVKNIN